ncbi:MAG: TIGR02281 family clan AA aspartic protease [Kiloniellaceae bacterium]
MSAFHQDSEPRSGLLGHSLKLAVAVIVSGLAVVFLVDREEAGPAAPQPAMPSRSSAATATSELVLKAGAHGHFMVEATVNGQPIEFLVDTGASSIYLTPADAARLGWTPPRLTYSERYTTASGVVHAAPVTLRSLRIGQFELYDLPASVGEAPGSLSLLGMSFLKRLEGYEVRGDRLILSW